MPEGPATESQRLVVYGHELLTPRLQETLCRTLADEARENGTIPFTIIIHDADGILVDAGTDPDGTTNALEINGDYVARWLPEYGVLAVNATNLDEHLTIQPETPADIEESVNLILTNHPPRRGVATSWAERACRHTGQLVASTASLLPADAAERFQALICHEFAHIYADLLFDWSNPRSEAFDGPLGTFLRLNDPSEWPEGTHPFLTAVSVISPHEYIAETYALHRIGYAECLDAHGTAAAAAFTNLVTDRIR